MRESKFSKQSAPRVVPERTQGEKNYLQLLHLSIPSDVERVLEIPFNILDVEITLPVDRPINPKEILPEGSVVTLYKRVEADFSWDSVQIYRSGLGRTDWEIIAVEGECSMSDQQKIIGAMQRLRF